jgi:hypothetical protein
MFIAHGPRQGSSPQRGDMFIAVASSTTILYSRRRRMQLFVATLLCHKARATCHPAGVKNHLVGRKAINISLLRSEDVTRRSRIVVKKETRSCSLAIQRNGDSIESLATMMVVTIVYISQRLPGE